VLATPAERALLVTHNTLLRLLLCDVLGVPMAAYRRRFPLVEHCALTELSVRDGSFGLRRFNAAPWGAVDISGPAGRWAAPGASLEEAR
jgi:broad specificity phosphatase PhoE